MLLKFTMQGKFLQQFGRRDQSGGNKDTKNLKSPPMCSCIARRTRRSSLTATGIAG